MARDAPQRSARCPAGTPGISRSTLSRLESGGRRPSLELLLPLAVAYRVPLDELVGAPEVGDPRVRLTPRTLPGGGTVVPLTRGPGPLQAFKMLIPHRGSEPDPRTHEGYEWLYVLDGRLRLVLGAHDLVLGPGEAAEFDTRLPHWFTRGGRWRSSACSAGRGSGCTSGPGPRPETGPGSGAISWPKYVRWGESGAEPI